MGGSNEIRIGMLRVHESGTKVHIHDDKKRVRFAMDVVEFEDHYNDLKEAIKNGAPTASFIDDDNVKLLACVVTKKSNRFEITWSIEAPAPVYDFATMDAFVGNL